MTKVHQLLEQIGLERYSALFAENDIDDEIVTELEDADLKELGISLGHRKKLLKAIAGLSRSAPKAVVTPRVAVEAEHRQLTVMFCDLVSSTALSHQLDVETYRELIAEYQSAATGAIEQFEGYVARYMGDGILSYFGYPQAHEDDAERAVRAALLVVETIGGLSPRLGTRLGVRIGIATGPVVVGDVIGEGASEEHAVLGETPNLAARLQQKADTGVVLIAGHTKTLIGRLFECTDAGAYKLKGFEQRVRAWRVVAESAADSRFDATRSPDQVPLIGRDSEVQLLVDRWQRVLDREGQVVLLSGEPGIGKSRLVHALRQHTAEHAEVLQFQCMPFYTNRAFYPFIQHIQKAAGFAPNDDVSTRRAKLASWTGSDNFSAPDVLLSVSTLLSLSGPDDTIPERSPSAYKERISKILVERFTLTRNDRPLLILFEDVHWADPTTLDVLERLIAAVASHATLLVITHRPVFAPPWQGQGQITAHSLSRLGKRQATQLIEGVTGGRVLPEVLSNEIISKADGVPLFVEELTKTVIESGLLKKTVTRYLLSGPLPSLSVPSTLRDSLVARLDRLPLGKEVAQIASVIGRQFSHELLAAVSGLDDGDLREALIQLEESELIFRHGSETDPGFIFKHALLQDAAYDSLLTPRRQQLHADIAAELEELFPETVAVEPELMAHHLSAAGLYAEAVDYWQSAAHSALEQSAYPESLSHLDSALQTLDNLPDRSVLRETELDIQIARGGVLMVSAGYLEGETKVAFTRARDLSLQLGDQRKKFAALRGLHGIHMVRAELDTALDVATECLAIAVSQGQLAMEKLAHRLVGQTYCLRGDLSRAREHLEHSRTLDSADSQGAVAALVHGGGHRLMTPSFLSHVLWLQGFADQALWFAEAALGEEADSYGAFAQTAGMYFLSWVYAWRREFHRVETVTSQMSAIAEEHGITAWVSTAEILPDWPNLEADPTPKRTSLARRRLKEVRAAVGLRTAYKLGLLALAIADDDPSDALAIVEDALYRTSVTGECWSDAELTRIKGEIHLREHPPATQTALQCFREARAIAEQQGALAWELRATMSEARVLIEHGEPHQALESLRTCTQQFHEGFDTADLKDAQALVDSLTT